MGYGPSNLMFRIVPIFITVIAISMLIMILVKAFKGISQWRSNNASPVLKVNARIVAKRADVSHHRHNSTNNMSHVSSSTTYYATFQVESGDRIELHIPDTEYGMLVEGDTGSLTFQGTRYRAFIRA